MLIHEEYCDKTIFKEKVFKFVQAQIYIFAVDYLSSAHLFFKRKANSTIEQQKCKGHEKRDQLLVSKVEFNFQISQ